ncbi:Rieske domain-containing protein-like [Mercenaria mercenaria]|uniref:Rieske domain-containing protein-like n=1 Tax=Mercenaria mercenaria TaxID=6596 RepID=UPI00234F39CA|nr:Rieske domain-containing protein-like [Mercenaria mercenaria]
MAEANELYVCSVSDLGTRNRKRITVAARDIFIVKAGDQFYALDSFCYHAGGPLYNGDIEDLGGRTCMVCPWHKYKVCLNTGQNYYQSVDPHNLDKPPKWTAGEVRQRTHTVTVRDGNIYVTLSSCDGTLDSDHYNKHKEK